MRPSGNAGQNCIGIERVLVHQDQYDELYREMIRRTEALRQGCAMPLPGESSIPMYDVGAMISRDRFEDIKRVVDVAADEGANVEQGGAPYPHPYLEAGSYFAPTVVGRANPDSELMQRESTLVSLQWPSQLITLLSVRTDCCLDSLRDSRRGGCDREWNSLWTGC